MAVLLGDALGLATQSIRSRKLHTFLTSFGVLIAVFVSLTTLGLTDAFEAYLGRSLSRVLGVTRMTVRQRSSRLGTPQGSSLTWEDAAAAARACDACRTVSPQYEAFLPVSRGAAKVDRVRVRGITLEGFELSSAPVVASGRSLVDVDLNRRAQVAVIASGVAETLFGPSDPIGQGLILAGTPLTVVGTLEPRGRAFGENLDELVLIPASLARRDYPAASLVIEIDTSSTDVVGLASDQIRSELRRRHKLRSRDKDDFVLASGESVLATWRQTRRTIWLCGALIVGLTVSVGMTVMSNTMLIAIVERTPEIGIRRAQGARRSDIVTQVLMETMALSLTGAVLGLFAAALVVPLLSAVLATQLSSSSDVHLAGSVSMAAALIALMGSLVPGVLAGLYPARRAARLDPIEALRRE